MEGRQRRGTFQCANCNDTLADWNMTSESDPFQSHVSDIVTSIPVIEFEVQFTDCERSVTLYEAINSVFSFILSSSDKMRDRNNHHRQLSQVIDPSSIKMCSKCAEIVTILYKSYVELMELSAATSVLAGSLQQVQTWHQQHGYYFQEEAAPWDPQNQIQNCVSSGEIGTADVKIEVKTECTEDEGGAENCEDLFFGGANANSVLAVGFGCQELNNFADVNQQLDSYNNVAASNCLTTAIVTEVLNVRRSTRNTKSSQVNLLPTDCPTPAKRRKTLFSGSRVQRNSKPDKKLESPTSMDTHCDPSLVPLKTSTPNESEDHFFDAVPIKKRKRYNRNAPYRPPGLPCANCGKKFRYHWMVEHHILAVHKHKKPKCCVKCGFEYYSEQIFETHVCVSTAVQREDWNNGKRVFRCKLCGKRLLNRGNFNRHCAGHDNKTVFPCQHPGCKLTFKIAENLAKHESFHYQEPAIWQCTVCGKLFKCKQRLVEHMDIHLDEKKYLCTDCGVRFAQKKALVRHAKIHQAIILRYQCPLCGKSFRRRDNVTQHLNSKVHPRELVNNIISQGIRCVDVTKL